jgi:hypothetical protein
MSNPALTEEIIRTLHQHDFGVLATDSRLILS